MNVDLSFVIPYIHEFPTIYSTLNNIQTEMFPEKNYTYEMIVVENGVKDENTQEAFTGTRALYRAITEGHPDFISGAGQGRIRYFFEPRQCGPVARNHGARQARGRYVMFMDAHTTLARNSVAPLIQCLEENPHCGGISGLTSWSYYERDSMGSYYELFLQPGQESGGPILPSHMHGHYMPLWKVSHRQPFKVVMGSQAYTMYRTEDFLEVGGYFDGCRFYPHPEGYMPLKIWMFGKEMWVHQDSWHIHGMFHRHYERSGAESSLEKIRFIVNSGLNKTYEQKLNEIRQLFSYVDSDEGAAKRAEYGGHSWHWHGLRNVFMIAYILGGEKWLNICCAEAEKRNQRELTDIRESAYETAFEERLNLLSNPNLVYETLDDILMKARVSNKYRAHELGRIWGMENWDDRIGEDPI